MIQDRLEVFYLLTSHFGHLSEEIDHCAFHMLHERDKSICVAALQARQAFWSDYSIYSLKLSGFPKIMPIWYN